MRIEQLVAKEHEISRELSSTLQGSDPGHSWVELERVRRRLPSDAVLIEFARYVVGNRQHKRWACSPSAVIPPADRGNVPLIDLGEAGPIDEAIANVRGVMRLDRVPNGEGEGGGGRGPRRCRERMIGGGEPPWRSWAGRSSGCSAPYIDPVPRWVPSPDSLALARPLAGPTAGWRPLRDRAALDPPGRQRPGFSFARSRPLDRRPAIFADPDFDLGRPPVSPIRHGTPLRAV